ncbi:hypothetical protein LTS14_010439 [Recurvomyces mirabilis]|nr:hypothetical protein LTS14_010439 [Recurvomyces mirabilis]
MSQVAAFIFLVLPAVLALERPGGVGRLPALGWNSWNIYGCNIDEAKVLEAANGIIDLGFKDAGYEYIIPDDCWSDLDGRDPVTFQLRPNATKFPDGIKGTADQVHALGLKYGIYSSAGEKTCGGYPASLGYEEIDAATFASWGVDYLKYDNCYVPEYWQDDCLACNADPTYTPDGVVNGSCTSATPEVKLYPFSQPSDTLFPLCALGWPTDGVNYTAKYTALRFRIMQNALESQNRTILYSLCEWGTDHPWEWANATGNSWRTTNDINPAWERILQILNLNSFITEYGDFTGHNDADMLEVGNGDLTVEEERTHFALWAMMKSPLIIGTNVTNLTSDGIEILQNKGLLAFNQDSVYGRPAGPYKWGVNEDWSFNSTFPAQYWSGASSNGTMVAMFNPFDYSMSMTASYAEIPQLDAGACYSVTDVWTGKDMGCLDSNVTMTVEAHDTAVLLVGPECS